MHLQVHVRPCALVSGHGGSGGTSCAATGSSRAVDASSASTTTDSWKPSSCGRKGLARASNATPHTHLSYLVEVVGEHIHQALDVGPSAFGEHSRLQPGQIRQDTGSEADTFSGVSVLFSSHSGPTSSANPSGPEHCGHARLARQGGPLAAHTSTMAAMTESRGPN